MTPRQRRIRRVGVATVLSLVVAACASDGESDDAGSTTPADDAPTTSAATSDDDADPSATDLAESADSPTSTVVEEPSVPSTDEADSASEEPDPEEPGGEDDAATGDELGPIDFRELDPPSGDPIVVGFVNSEGAPALDFPDMRIESELAADFLNQHGGYGDRPIEMVPCIVSGTPESSQECAQTLAGEGVELVMLGLDLFPAYDTYAAGGIPVFGAIPILPQDFTADALYVTGGNATAMAGIAGYAADGLGASTVAIISPDNAGGNSSLTSLTASLDVLGVEYVSVTGGPVETDAGFQGLMREATKDGPDAVVSLYDDSGCIGAIRARVALGLDIPGLSTPVCGSATVLETVGDEADGWYFAGTAATDDSVTSETLNQIVEPEYGPDAGGSLGIGALGISLVMSLASVANALADEGVEVTGPAMYDRLAASDDIVGFPFQAPFECGTSDVYSSVCSFVIPVSTYDGDGGVEAVPGFEVFSVVEYLP